MFVRLTQAVISSTDKLTPGSQGSRKERSHESRTLNACVTSGRTRLFVNGTNPSAPSGTASGESQKKKSKHTLVIVDTSRLAGEAIADAAAIAMAGSRPGRGRV